MIILTNGPRRIEQDNIFTSRKSNSLQGKGPIGKFLVKDCQEIMLTSNAKIGDSIFLACGNEKDVEKLLSSARDKIANDLKLIDDQTFAFCWTLTIQCMSLTKNQKK